MLEINFNKSLKKISNNFFKKIKKGSLIVSYPDNEKVLYKGTQKGYEAEIKLYNYKVFSKLLIKGSIGFAESYMEKDFTSENLSKLLLFAYDNQSFFIKKGLLSEILNKYRKVKHRLNENTKSRSKKNISFHYDLGNEFYKLWLDNSMTYSCGIFENENSSMEDASYEKIDRLCRKINLCENDNIFTGTVSEQLYVPGLVYNNRHNNINVVSEPPSNKDNSKAAALQFVKQQLLLNGDESNNSTVNNLDTFTFDGIGEQNPCGEEEATYNDDSLMWMEDMDTSSSDESATLSPFLSSNASSMLTGASLFDFAVDRDFVPNSKSSVANNTSNSNNNKLPSTFTDEENNIINDGVDNEWSWEDIASKCNNKTAKQCSQQWRKIVKTVSVHEVPWTKEEDGIIRKGVEEGMSWQNIAKLTKRRLSRQCSQRWRKVLDPSIKRFVKWSKEEDLKLMELHRNYPTMTNKEMSSHLPGRTSTQCHNRWVEVLNPDLRRGVFSEEEDLRILELRKAGQGWSAMAKDSILIGRANVALKNRWHTLTKRNKNAQKRKVKAKASRKS